MKMVIFLAVCAASCFSQTNETVPVFHEVPLGGSSAIYSLFPTYSYILNAPTGSAFSQFSIPRNDPPQFGSSLSGVGMPLLTAITGSTSSQSVNMPTTTGITTYLVIDGGTSLQEIIFDLGVVDATHINAIVRNSHSVGAVIRCVYSSYSKYLVAATVIPGGWSYSSLANFGLIRMSSLPMNIYDQYQTYSSGSSYGCAFTADHAFPWASSATATFAPVPLYSPSSVSATGNPTNAVALNAGPITTSTNVGPLCVQVQVFFTSTPELDASQLIYRYWWDRS